MDVRTDSSLTGHWDRFYVSGEIPQLPSQFAVFMLGEYPQTDAIVDFGCGNGRDAMFFARHGKPTIGVDGSRSAVDSCRASSVGLDTSHFVHSSIANASCGKDVSLLVQEARFLMIYARFFLHAISEDDELNLLKHAAFLLKGRDGVFGLEFRTPRDEGQTKVTPAHYRRFVEPSDFLANARIFGFRSTYSVEARGMAKYKNDDAHVARVVLTTGR